MAILAQPATLGELTTEHSHSMLTVSMKFYPVYYTDISSAVAPNFMLNPVRTVQLLHPAALILTCTAVGFPLPTISWIRTFSNGSEMEFTVGSTEMDGRDFTVFSTSDAMMFVGSIFMISSTVVLDTANYTCRASNTVGMMDSTSTVFVKYSEYLFIEIVLLWLL